MKKVYEYLELYQNSEEVEKILAPYDDLLLQLHELILKVQDMCFVKTSEKNLWAWLRLYSPPPSDLLTDEERVLDALSFFVGAPLWRIKQVLARMCKCDTEDIQITETKDCYVLIALPVNAEFTADVYTSYINHIKPAHVALYIHRRRTHGMMHASTHGELSLYTHSGMLAADNR